MRAWWRVQRHLRVLRHLHVSTALTMLACAFASARALLAARRVVQCKEPGEPRDGEWQACTVSLEQTGAAARGSGGQAREAQLRALEGLARPSQLLRQAEEALQDAEDEAGSVKFHFLRVREEAGQAQAEVQEATKQAAEAEEYAVEHPEAAEAARRRLRTLQQAALEAVQEVSAGRVHRVRGGRAGLDAPVSSPACWGGAKFRWVWGRVHLKKALGAGANRPRPARRAAAGGEGGP
eukprot:COSAG01_NODE_6368_length_3709_cov_208.854571_7_plen_237_part_00